uniref:Packaging ATPase n=1 Tax=Dikerogammarus haemobaphes virus 1 TaxID=2704946 RepID=A0A6G9HDM9_9VIRU|nr:packaging ATPase [Dikerogammarus haemobaphes virus 1]
MKSFSSVSEFAPGSWFIVGPPDSGKTTAVKSFFLDKFNQSRELNQPFFPHYTTSIAEEVDSFSNIIPRKFISNKLNIADARSRIKWLNENYRSPKNVILVYDDVVNFSEGKKVGGAGGNSSASKGKFHRLLEELVTKGSRHLKADILITSQYHTLLEPSTRNSFSYYMFIIGRSGVPINNLGNANSTKNSASKNFASLCDIDGTVFQNWLQSTFLSEAGDFRILFIYDRLNACYYWKKFTAPSTTSIVKDYLNCLKNVPGCFIKSSNRGGGGDISTEEVGDVEMDEDDSNLEHELSVISMMKDISRADPDVCKILQKTKNFKIIEREHLKAKAVLKFRNKLNIFYILYNTFFIMAEYVDKYFNIGQIQGLSGYRELMSEDDKASERDLITAVVETYIPHMSGSSPVLDLALHTFTVIIMARLNVQMTSVLDNTLGEIRTYRGQKKGNLYRDTRI